LFVIVLFFERSDCFEKKHHIERNGEVIKAIGLNYPFGKTDYYGSYVKVNHGDSSATISSTLIHEYGHAMHGGLSNDYLGFDSYASYNEEMKEVIAISATRTKYKKNYDKPPHKTAYDLILRLEKISEYTKLPFHKQWRFLLNYTNHKMLEKHIQLMERLTPHNFEPHDFVIKMS